MTDNRFDEIFQTHSDFERLAGYHRAIRRGEWVFCAGITGFNYENMTISDSLVDQVQQAFDNLDSALTHFGANKLDIVQFNWIVVRQDFFYPAGEMIREYFGGYGPPAMTLVCDLVDSRMKFEVQATAMMCGTTKLNE